MSTWTVQVPVHMSRNTLPISKSHKENWTRIDCPKERKARKLEAQEKFVEKIDPFVGHKLPISEDNESVRRSPDKPKAKKKRFNIFGKIRRTIS